MASKETGLNVLRTRTLVDCDTLDVNVVRKFGPFQDCTSNQAIAFFELSKPIYADLLRSAVVDAKQVSQEASNKQDSNFSGVTLEELAVELSMVTLAINIASHIEGRVHVQTNPYYSYSTEKTVGNAHRIVSLFKHKEPHFDTTRICIKIPSTWEGMMACQTLQLAGIHTLATTLFSFSQAVLAAEVGCTYIAPYVNQLKVHFEPGFADPNKLFTLCVKVQKYYKSIGSKTQVLPASLTSTEEIFELAGVDHITIAPGLLEQLAQPGYVSRTVSLFDGDLSNVELPSQVSYLNDPAAFRIAFTRDLGGVSEEKLTQAINIFCDMQDKLTALVKAKM